MLTCSRCQIGIAIDTKVVWGGDPMRPYHAGCFPAHLKPEPRDRPASNTLPSLQQLADAGYPMQPDGPSVSAYPDLTRRPSLSLLVLDLGDSTVVKVESGSIEPFYGERLVRGRIWFGQGIHFSAIRGVIDASMGDKPCPRLEQADGKGGGYDLYWHNNPPGGLGYLFPAGYEALCQLAGVTIPVYEGGKWERLLPVGKFSNGTPYGDETGGVEIWRFMR